MGKTIRRKRFGKGKNKREYPFWVTFRYEVKSREWVKNDDNELKKCISIYHSDSHFPCWDVPARFRKEIERKRRRNAKFVTRDILRRGQSGDVEIDDDDYIPIKRTVVYEWW